jgi:hypothetical protein
MNTIHPANEALARMLDAVACDYLLARYGGPGNPMGTQVLRRGSLVATKVPFAPANPLMNTARGIEHADDVDALLAFYGSKDSDADAGARDAAAAHPQAARACWVETSPYTPQAATDALLARGFRLERQAATLYALPVPEPEPEPRWAHAAGAAVQGGAPVVRTVARDDLPEFLNTLNRGFGTPEAVLPGLRANQSFWGDVPGWHLFQASIDDAPAGAAVLSVHAQAGHGPVGYLAAASTLTALRGRGVQGALIAARSERARALGCELLAGQAAWGSTSQANMQRAGMQISHLRSHWTCTLPA